MGLYLAYFKAKLVHLGDLGLDLGHFGEPGPGFGPSPLPWTNFKPKSTHLKDLWLDLGHLGGGVLGLSLAIPGNIGLFWVLLNLVCYVLSYSLLIALV